jgi:hypothetical protein
MTSRLTAVLPTHGQKQFGVQNKWKVRGATVALADKPEFPVADRTSQVFDNIDDKREFVTAQFGPRPVPNAVSSRPRPAILPDTFTALVAGHE